MYPYFRIKNVRLDYIKTHILCKYKTYFLNIFSYTIIFPDCAIHAKQLLPVQLAAPYWEYKKHSAKQRYC